MMGSSGSDLRKIRGARKPKKESELQDDHNGRLQWAEKSRARAELAELGTVASAYELSSQEVEAGRLGVQGQPELCETLSQNNQKIEGKVEGYGFLHKTLH